MGTVIELGKPNAKQDLFLRDTHRHVGFGGARGGGKSWAVRTKAVLLASKYKGISQMIVRKSFPELEANHIAPFRKLLGIGRPGCPFKFNESKKIIRFPNGSTIRFAYCDRDSDTDRYQGTEVDVLYLDEATQLSEQQIHDLNACVRGTNPEFPLRTYYTCNPGGKGHAYIKRLFVDRQYVGKEKPEQYSFIQSLVYDNKVLLEAHPEYVDELENLPEARRKAWLYGDWNSFVGQVFVEWRDDPHHYQDRRWTHVIDDFPVDSSWKIYRSFDFGYAKPFSVGWYAVDHVGKIYRIREYYGCTGEPNVGLMLTPQEIAKTIREIESTDPNLKGKQISGIADPAIWDKSHGESIAEMMEQERIYFSPGDHARLAGKMQFHYRLAFDSMGIPMFYCFKSCRHFIRTIPILIYDEKKVEDIDTTLEDHIYDEARYLFMEHPLNPRKAEEKKMPAEDPLNQWTQPRTQRGGLYA